jgi:hypothetical protein
MNRHYDRYLVKKYEPLYRDRSAPMTHTAMCWGFEVGNGWFHILNQLSYMLCSDWIQAKSAYEFLKDREGLTMFKGQETAGNPIVTKEAIEKARLRVETEYMRVPLASQVKEKYGTLRFHIHGGTDVHYAYIDMAEALSSVTCEVCGGKGRRSHYGWIVTRCKEHEDD